MAMQTNFGTSGPCLQGTVAADRVLCMHAKGEASFAEHVLQKLEERDRLSLLLAQKEEKEHKKHSVPSPTEEDMKPMLTEDKKNKKEQEAPKKKKAKKARLSTHAQLCSV